MGNFNLKFKFSVLYLIYHCEITYHLPHFMHHCSGISRPRAAKPIQNIHVFPSSEARFAEEVPKCKRFATKIRNLDTNISLSKYFKVQFYG